MPKNNRKGQSAILTETDYSRIRKQFISEKHKLLWDIAKFTGERWGAIIQLQVLDVYDNKGNVREEITFRAVTRKASPDGKRRTRQVPVHPTLMEILKAYKPPAGVYLFPGPFEKPMSRQAADAVMRKAIEKAGLTGKGISTHSTRRTFITRLNEAGIDISTIRAITGHQDIKSLNRYIEVSPNRIKGAISAI